MSDSWTQYNYQSILALNRHTRRGRKEDCLKLLESARDSSAFSSYVHTLIKKNGGDLLKGKKLPQFSKIDEGEFKNLSWKTQGQPLWESMKELSPVDACQSGLWLYATLSAIDSDAIQSHYLASGMNGSNDTGLARIDESLKNPDKPAQKKCANIP